MAKGYYIEKSFEFQIMTISGFWKLTIYFKWAEMKQENCQIPEDSQHVYDSPSSLENKNIWTDINNLFVTRIHKSLEVIARIDRMLTADVGQGHGPVRWGEHTYLTVSFLLQS